LDAKNNGEVDTPIDVPEEIYTISDEYNRYSAGRTDEEIVQGSLPPQFKKYFVEYEWENEYSAGLPPAHVIAIVKIPGLATIHCILSVFCGCIFGYIASVDEYVPKWACEDARITRVCKTPQEVIKLARHIYMTRFRHKNE